MLKIFILNKKESVFPAVLCLLFFSFFSYCFLFFSWFFNFSRFQFLFFPSLDMFHLFQEELYNCAQLSFTVMLRQVKHFLFVHLSFCLNSLQPMQACLIRQLLSEIYLVENNFAKSAQILQGSMLLNVIQQSDNESFVGQS